jgi:hypothetical protein
MNPLNWEITITLRPIRVLSRFTSLGVLCLACLIPGNETFEGDRAGIPVPVVRVIKSEQQLKLETAQKAVRLVLDARMPALNPEKRAQLAQVVVDESLACGIDPLFTLAVGDVESKFDHEAISVVIGKNGQPRANAKGLFQLIDQTWGHETRRRHLVGAEKFDPTDNARVGIGYLCSLKDGPNGHFKRPDSLVLAYNQGPGMATSILKGESEGDYQAPVYAPAVWSAYKKMLKRFSLPNDGQAMRLYYARPDLTIYATVISPRETEPLLAKPKTRASQ